MLYLLWFRDLGDFGRSPWPDVDHHDLLRFSRELFHETLRWIYYKNQRYFNKFKNGASENRTIFLLQNTLFGGELGYPETSIFALRPPRNSIFTKCERRLFSNTFPRPAKNVKIKTTRFCLYVEQKAMIFKISGGIWTGRFGLPVHNREQKQRSRSPHYWHPGMRVPPIPRLQYIYRYIYIYIYICLHRSCIFANV